MRRTGTVDFQPALIYGRNRTINVPPEKKTRRGFVWEPKATTIYSVRSTLKGIGNGV